MGFIVNFSELCLLPQYVNIIYIVPQEVFERARILLIYSKGDFTETEKRIIDEHVNGCESFKDWSSLGRKLGREPKTLRTYARIHIHQKEKNKRGGFTAEESKKVLDHVLW